VERTGRLLAALLLAGAAAGLTMPVEAQMQIGLRAIEARVGFADLEDEAGSTFILSAAADMGRLTEQLLLELNADFWTKTWDTAADAEWQWTNFALLANARYPFSLGESPIHPFAFGGLGLHYWKADWDCPQCDGFLGDDDESGLEFGLDLGAGADFGAADAGIIPTARLGYNFNGGADYLFISGGVKFPVGK